MDKWVKKYIGKEYSNRGRGPDHFDCWGLVWCIYKNEFDLEIPSYSDEYNQTVSKEIPRIFEREHKLWQSINPGDEQIGDVVVLNIKGRPWHVGLVVESGKMIHIEKNKNTCIEKYNSPLWKNKINGFYRYQR